MDLRFEYFIARKNGNDHAQSRLIVSAKARDKNVWGEKFEQIIIEEQIKFDIAEIYYNAYILISRVIENGQKDIDYNISNSRSTIDWSERPTSKNENLGDAALRQEQLWGETRRTADRLYDYHMRDERFAMWQDPHKNFK